MHISLRLVRICKGLSTKDLGFGPYTCMHTVFYSQVLKSALSDGMIYMLVTVLHTSKYTLSPSPGAHTNKAISVVT